MKNPPLLRVSPLRDLGGRLLEVEKPARYLGGEVGSIRKGGEGFLDIGICFPDLYEIGMSNNAVRILYSGLNAVPGVRAERVFAPAPDFEALLAKASLPLYTLETGIALSDLDILGISIGYELAATSILAVLSSGRIPLRAEDRGEGDPIVLAGGPASTNPHPFAAFLDGAYIGEAEANFFALTGEMAEMKARGACRSDLMDALAKDPAVWLPGGRPRPAKRARRAVYSLFSSSPASTSFPLPTVKTVQDHGTVEIMRGCPNGCRFCHAGFYYRPQREKPYRVIRDEIEELVTKGGYREITLSSLSSGDYSDIGTLLDRLNAEYGPRKISFQLPSLKVNTFTLPIIAKLAEVRKSGLTFAVETPIDEWQRGINKEVSFDKTVAILEEAKASGYKQAKFYFMIGLPVPGRGMGEAEAIVDFFRRLQSRIQMQIHVNLGVFVPKPHTPYQREAQLSEDEALAAISYLRTELRRYRNIRVSYHSPFNSQLEGVIARGDERVGELLLEAFRRGARLDAWDENFDREMWRSVLDSADWPVIAECCSGKGEGDPLPWDDISVRVSSETFERERRKSETFETTSACVENCTKPCGVCGSDLAVQKTDEPHTVENSAQAEVTSVAEKRKPQGRVVLRYKRVGVAAYLQHLSIVDAFNRAFQIAGIDVAYSEGFNPMPRFETAQPISIAIDSEAEVASILVYSDLDPDSFGDIINPCLPEGLEVLEARYFPIVEGLKQCTIGSLEWGSEYSIADATPELTERLASSLASRLSELGIEGASAIVSGDRRELRLVVPMAKKKEHGLIKLLEASSEYRPVQSSLKIVRVRLMATSLEGSPVSFFEAYSQR